MDTGASKKTLEQVQSHLRAILDSPVSHSDELIWAAVSQALGRVRHQLRRLERDPSHARAFRRAVAANLEGRELHGDITELAEIVTEALVLADRLDETTAALLLNDALIEITGRGLSPPGADSG